MTLVFFFSPVAAKQRERGEEKRKEIIINANAHSMERDPWLLSTAVIHEALHFLHRRFKQNSCYLEHSILPHTHKQAMAPHLARWSHTSGHSSRTVPHLEGRSQIWPRQRETSSIVLLLPIPPWSPYVKKDAVNELKSQRNPRSAHRISLDTAVRTQLVKWGLMKLNRVNWERGARREVGPGWGAGPPNE